MSFSFAFTAKSRKSAAEKLRKQQNVPHVVAAIAEQAIASAPEGILEVSGSGHLANGVTDTYGNSQNVDVKVRSIAVED